MSPRPSDYRSEEFDDEAAGMSYRRDFSVEDGRSTIHPVNRPSRTNTRRVKASHNGMQRRRNKHWNW